MATVTRTAWNARQKKIKLRFLLPTGPEALLLLSSFPCWCWWTEIGGDASTRRKNSTRHCPRTHPTREMQRQQEEPPYLISVAPGAGLELGGKRDREEQEPRSQSQRRDEKRVARPARIRALLLHPLFSIPAVSVSLSLSRPGSSNKRRRRL